MKSDRKFIFLLRIQKSLAHTQGSKQLFNFIFDFNSFVLTEIDQNTLYICVLEDMHQKIVLLP